MGKAKADTEPTPSEGKVPAEPGRTEKKPSPRGVEWDPDAPAPVGTASVIKPTTTILTKAGVTTAMIEAREHYRRRVRQLLISPGKSKSGRGTVSPLNIVGTGFGQKWSSGRPTGKMCVHVFVRSKAPEEHVHPEMLPPRDSFKGEKVHFDVVQIGRPRIHGFQIPEKPAAFGASISTTMPGGLTGSYGCRVWRKPTPDHPDGQMCILSNNHILANMNAGERGVTEIVQPGGADAWSASIQHTIGHLVDYVELNWNESPGTPSAPNVDAAIALTATTVCAPRFHNSYQYDPTPVDPAPNMTVFKEGRTTDYTQGTIFSVGFHLDSMPYPNGLHASFEDLIIIHASFGTPFSQEGDSGSLINAQVGNVYRPVGLLLGGDGGLNTFAHPIQTVFDALNIGNLQYDPSE